MVIFDRHHSDNVTCVAWLNFQDQSKLAVEPHRPLMFAWALQFFVVQRLEGIKISFIRSRPNQLHPPPESLHQVFCVTSVEAYLFINPVQGSVAVAIEHGDRPFSVRFGVSYNIRKSRPMVSASESPPQTAISPSLTT
jgi:hypothetical protein